MSTTAEFAPYLAPGRFVDSDHPAVVAFAREHTRELSDPCERAVALYYAVRDGYRYDPYRIDLSDEGFLASTVTRVGSGFCVPKATLLAAACRAAGIPARLGFADVRNHLTSPRLHRQMGTDVFVYHGYAELWLARRWVKATPAFNLSLCEKAGVLPLEFDGHADSLFHPSDAGGRRHMEDPRDHGTHVDVPVEEIIAAWRAAYPSSSDWGHAELRDDFEREAVASLQHDS